MSICIFAKMDVNGTPVDVCIEVHDLTAFVHAPPDADICVVDRANNAYMPRKDTISELRIEGIDTPQGEWPSDEETGEGAPPHDAATATGMYDHD